MVDIKVAIPLYRNKLSARFEYATEAMIVKAREGKILEREKVVFHHSLNVSERVTKLSSMGVSLVICCRPSADVRKSLMQHGLARAEPPLLGTEIKDLDDFIKEASSFAHPGYEEVSCN